MAGTIITPFASSITVEAAQTGWVKNGNYWKYYGKDGKAYTGWRWMTSKEGEKTPHWSYFGSNGNLRTGWIQLGKGTKEPDGNTAKHWSYFGGNGWLRTGWIKLGKGTSEPDGNSTPHWSYFGDNGWLREGWQQMGKGTNNPDGNSAKHWSYFGGNGWLRTGWVELGKGTSEPDGNSARHYSYFGDNGWLRTGLQNMGNGTNNPDGNAANHKSYFGDNGWLVVNKDITVSGVKYKADSRGWLTEVNNNPVQKYTVTFTDGNGKTLKIQTVEKGKSATAPEVPAKDGNMFAGWSRSFYNVNSDLTVNATWKMINMVELRNNMLKRINSERKKAGVGELKMLAFLNECAQEKSKDMYNNRELDHYSPTLGYIDEQFKSHGLVPAMASENIAENVKAGNLDYNSIVDAWLNSKDGHRENMLDPDMKQVGIGYYNGYWTLQMIDELFTSNPFGIQPVDKCCYCGEDIKKLNQQYAVRFTYSNKENDFQWIRFYLYYCKENNKVVNVYYLGRDFYDMAMDIMKSNYKNEKDIFNNISWYRETYDSNNNKYVQSEIKTPKVYDLYELLYGYKP